MAVPLEPAEIAGHQPAINDGFEREFWIIEIVRHDRLAADSDFANPFGVGTQNAEASLRASGLPTVSARKGLRSLSVNAVPASLRP